MNGTVKFLLSYCHEINLYSALRKQFRLSHIKCNWKLFIVISINFANPSSTSNALDKKIQGFKQFEAELFDATNSSYG